MTASPAAGRVRKPKRDRTLTESLLSIVLGLEAVLIFFVALTVYGLHALSAPVALVGGAATIVILVLATRIVRWNWGVWVGWVIQLGLLATGLLLPALYIAAGIFVAFWIYCFVRGRQVDRANALLRAETSPTPSTPTEGETS